MSYIFINTGHIELSITLLDGFLRLLHYHYQSFQQFLNSVITYLSVCGACRAFSLTEEADADAV